jgi:hypothetical protein
MKKDETNQTAAEVLQDFMNQNSMSYADFGEWLGVSGSAVGAWITKGVIPDYAARAIKLAAEVKEARALHREAVEELSKPSDVRSIIVKGPSETLKILTDVAERLPSVETLDLDF